MRPGLRRARLAAERQDPHRPGDAVEGGGHGGAVVLPGVDRPAVVMEAERPVLERRLRVVVGQDHDVGTGEERIEALGPLAGAHRVGRCGEAELLQAVNVLLALDDEHGVLERDRLDELRKVIGHLAHALHRPDPAVLHLVGRVVGRRPPALPEVLGIEADCLEEEIAALVDIVVGGDDLRPRRWRGLFGLGTRRVAARPPVVADVEALLAEPVDSLAVQASGLAADQVEDAAALPRLVIEPGASLQVDGERAVVAEAELVLR